MRYIGTLDPGPQLVEAMTTISILVDKNTTNLQSIILKQSARVGSVTILPTREAKDVLTQKALDLSSQGYSIEQVESAINAYADGIVDGSTKWRIA